MFDNSCLLPVCILRDRMEDGTRIHLTSHNDALFRPNSKPVAKAIKSEHESYTFTPYHYHEGVEILRIVEGEASIVINNRLYRVRKGDVAIVNPFEPHGIYLGERSADFARDCISFQPMELFPAAGKGGSIFSQMRSIAFSSYIPASESADMRRILDRIISDADNATEGWTISVLASIAEFYSLAVRQGCYSLSQNELPAQLEFMTKVSSYIDSNLSASISTADAAAFCQYSPEHFCRLFKKCFHSSFLDYLNIYRIQKAKTYVDEGNYPTVSELSAMFGFANQNHFGNTFKKHTGVLPSVYIKERKQKENIK